ncbi:secretin N-terminal domain-containing protein [Alienimonas sp. DA493]|uniref:secretin N-terminal domain-containing protein n=1 Tax=Alienimonas sp. DA493 TaxID=3373605 RepID=UPI003754895B
MSRSIALSPHPLAGGFGRHVLWAATLALVCSAPAFAQRGPGGGRGPGGPPQLFENEGFREEVGLTDEQVEKLRALREETRGMDREKIGEMFRNATTDEERQKVREQIGEQMRAAEQKFQEQASEVFTDEQQERYRQLQIRQRGVSGLIENDDLAGDLNLTDEQRAAMREIRDAEVAKLRESGDWGKFRDPEWRQQLEEKMLEKVSEEQRNAYQQKIGEEPSYNLFGGGDRRGGAGPQRVSGRSVGTLREFDTAVPEGATATIDFGRRPAAEPAMSDAASATEAADAAASEPDREAGPAAVAEGQVGVEEETMSFNFRYAPWEPVLREFAEFAGLTLDPGPVPPGTFNYFDDGQYTATEALDILNGYLLQRGYVLVRRDRFLICANIDEGIPPNLVPDVALEDLPDRGDNELVRVVIPLQAGDAKTAVQEIEPFLGPQGTAASLTAMNSVVVRDIGGNVRRIAALLGELGQEIVFEQIPLKHLDAYDAAMAVRTQLGIETNNSRDPRRRGGNNNDDEEISVAADERTQTLLVTARPEQILLVKEILKAVDVSEDADGNPIAYASSRPVFRSYALQSADPDDVRDTIVGLFPDAMVNEDDRGRAVHVNAAPGQQERIAEIIEQIDGNVRAETQSVVIPLSRLDPLSVTLTLNNMFITEGENAPVVEPDPLGRRLLVRASPDQVSEIKQLLLQLGEDGTGQRAAGGTLRTLSLGGRDPDRMIPLLRQMWEVRDPSPIRIVTPAAPNAVDRRGAPASRTQEEDEGAPQTEARLDDPFRVLGGPNFSLPQEDPAVPPPAEAPAEPQPADSNASAAEPTGSLEDALEAAAGNASDESPTASDPNAPVTMTVLDGQLVLYSENEEKLNELEDLVARLGALIPPDNGWNVFYLVNADATTTAETLEQLIPSASVAGTSSDGSMMGTMASGLSEFGGSLMDVAGVSSLGGVTSLKIVPDVRANALYVQGPREGVRQVEQLLTVLDADSRPDNARERLPRTIPVQYADVNEVAEIVREVFKEQTADGMAAQMASRSRGGRGGGGGDNPLAMLMGGMAGGPDAAAVQLSIGVDTRTSRLVVSAPESLFQQVEDLVQDLDDAAKDAERGVQFMTLRDANPSSVTAALSSMMPRVSSGGGSVVRSPRSTGGGSSSSSSSSSSDDNARGGDAAARALMFQQLMRNRGGGGGDGGGRGGFGGRGGDDDGGGRGGGGGRGRGGRGGR